jgi:UrcA family protein
MSRQRVRRFEKGDSTVRILLTSIALGMICAAPAAADPVGESYSVAIQYGDLNLDSPAGAAAFNGRVKAQANAVCGQAFPAWLEEAANVRKCRADFLRTAKRNLQFASAVRGGTVVAGR